MEFVQLLNYNHFFTLFKARSDEARVDLCVSVLLSSVKIVFTENSHQVYNIETKTMLWRKQEVSLNDYLQSLIATFLSFSVKALLNDNPPHRVDALMFEENDEKFFQSLEKGAMFGSMALWKTKLTCTNLKFDEDLTGIHFNNGRFDLNSGLFAVRNPFAEVLITKCIDYDYVPFGSNEEAQTKLSEFWNFLSKIFVEPDVMNYVCSVFGRALRGDTSECDLLYLYGSGANGKSTVLDLLRRTLGDTYFMDIKSDAFDTTTEANWNCTNITSTHRILFWDEPTAKKKVSSHLKALCNGKITTRRMGKDSNVTKIIHAKMFVASNKIVLFDTGNDGGINRRFNYYRCKSTFVKPPAFEDPSKFQFLALPIGDPNYMMSSEEKMIVFHFFAHFNSMKVSPPSCIVKGTGIFDIKKVCDYSLVQVQHASIALDDLLVVIEKLHPFHIIDKRTIVAHLEKSNISIDLTKTVKAISGKKVKGAVINVQWSEWGIKARTENVAFEFSELPQLTDQFFDADIADIEANLNEAKIDL